MDTDSLPKISIIIPTFNNEKTIEECLDRIFMQDYPRNKFEVILVDGGSTDKTLEIIQKYPVKILHNKNRIEQGRNCGRDLGYRNARYELIAWIDADNLIIGDRWLRKMVTPFLDNQEIFAVEPRPYAKRSDIGIIRYLSHTTRGQDSFMCTYLYDWDALPHIDEGRYSVYQLTPENSAGVGCCNGLLIKKAFIDAVGGFDYDIDVIYRIVSQGHSKIARAKAYYVHETVGSFYDFMKKRYRVICEYFYFKSERIFPWSSILKRPEFLKYLLYSLFLFGPTIFAVRKYKIFNDKALFYHPFASLMTVMIYALYVLLNPKCWKEALSMFITSRGTLRRVNLFNLLLWILIGLYGILFSYLSILRHYAFQTSAWDLGIYNQAFYTTVRHGMLFYNTVELYGNPSGSLFGGHFSPILFFVVPFYALFPIPETLLVVQSFVIAFGAAPLFWFARDEIGNNRAGFIFAFMYLLYSPLQKVNLFDFHPQAFLPTLMLFAIYYFIKGKWLRYFLFVVLSMMTNEWVGLIVAFFGLGGLLIYKGSLMSMQQKSLLSGRILSVITIVTGLTWTYLAKLAIKTVNPSPPIGFAQGSPWTILGFNPLDLHLDYIFHSEKVYEALTFDWSVKLNFLLWLFGPTAFFSLLGAGLLIPSVPWLVATFLSNNPPYYQIGWQYPSFVVPFIFAATVRGLKFCAIRDFTVKLKIRLRSSSLKIRLRSSSLIIFPLFCSLIFSACTSLISPLSFPGIAFPNIGEEATRFPIVTPHDKLLATVIELIPKEASVLTQYNIFPHVSGRLNAYVLPPKFSAFDPTYYGETIQELFNRKADYILIDTKPDNQSGELKRVARQVLSKMSDNPIYGLYISVDGIMLFKRGYVKT